MKKFLVLALLASTSTAWAADLSVTKAPVGYPYDTSGFYWGIGTWGGGGHVTASVPGVSSAALVTNQIAGGGIVGYAWGSPSRHFAIEGALGITNINGETNGLSLQGPAAGMIRAKAGIPLADLLSMFPSLPVTWTIPPFPPLPNGQVATNVYTYAWGGAKFDDISANFGNAAGRDWRIAPAIGLGMMGQLTRGMAADVWVGTAFPEKGVCIGGVACATLGQQVLVGGSLLY